VAGLLIDFDNYTRRGRVDFLHDLVGYRQIALWLTAEETVAMIQDLNRAIVPRLTNPPASDRVRRSFSPVLMPAGGGPCSVRDDGAATDGDAGDGTATGDAAGSMKRGGLAADVTRRARSARSQNAESSSEMSSGT